MASGELQHPIYSFSSVVPFGQISRRDDLKTAANQSIIEVTFWETIGAIYPLQERDAAAEVEGALFNQLAESSGFFDGLVEKSNAVQESAFVMNATAIFERVSEAVGPIIQAGSDTFDRFNDIRASVTRGIDVLIAQPLTLASQTIQMIRAPGRELSLIGDRLDAFENLIGQTVTYQAPDQPSRVDANEFLINDLTATAAVSGSVVSVLNGNFQSRGEAIQAADQILIQFDMVNEWREEQFTALAGVPDRPDLPALTDTGESYEALQATVALTVGFLIEQSFFLLQERVIILDRERTIVDLAGELYGNVTDETLNLLINSNNLSGSEIIELPRGRRVSYYV